MCNRAQACAHINTSLCCLQHLLPLRPCRDVCKILQTRVYAHKRTQPWRDYFMCRRASTSPCPTIYARTHARRDAHAHTCMYAHAHPHEQENNFMCRRLSGVLSLYQRSKDVVNLSRTRYGLAQLPSRLVGLQWCVSAIVPKHAPTSTHCPKICARTHASINSHAHMQERARTPSCKRK